MARGFLSGAIWGGVVSVLGAGGFSVAVGLSERSAPQPRATAVDVPAGSGFQTRRNDGQAVKPAEQKAPMGGVAPKMAAPAPDDLKPLQKTDLDPGAMPAAGEAKSGMAAPAGGGAAPGTLAAMDKPADPGIQTQAPLQPRMEAEPKVSTDPAQPKPAKSAPAITPAEPGGTGPVVQSQSPQEPMAGGAQDNDNATKKPSAVAATGDVKTAVVAPDPAPKPPVVTPVTPPVTQPGAEAEAPPKPGVSARPLIQPSDDTAAPTIRIGKPSGGFKNLAPGVSTSRLPKVAAVTPSVTPSATPSTGAAATPNAGEQTPKAADLPPVKRFASDAQVSDNKPKMAIVLIDDGTGAIGVEALSTFPYPLSFAVDAARPDAEARMKRYRELGFEVLALVSLPVGARASDVETAMPVFLKSVPEAVGVMEAPGNGIQSSRIISDQVSAILGESGHGLLLFSKGLNTAQKLAAKSGVPSATVFRDFDSKGQKPSAIRRFLNHGALKAGNEGGVVMVGRLRADTVTALLVWGLQDRPKRVVLAPVSHLLKAQ